MAATRMMCFKNVVPERRTPARWFESMTTPAFSNSISQAPDDRSWTRKADCDHHSAAIWQQLLPPGTDGGR